MSETTDFATLLHFKSMQNQIEELTTLLKNAERERNEWRITASSLKAGESELLKENAKLRDIAEMAVKNIREARNLSVIGDWREIDIIQERLRAELDQLKEGWK